jgi:hypothetical protein
MKRGVSKLSIKENEKEVRGVLTKFFAVSWVSFSIKRQTMG